MGAKFQLGLWMVSTVFMFWLFFTAVGVASKDTVALAGMLFSLYAVFEIILPEILKVVRILLEEHLEDGG